MINIIKQMPKAGEILRALNSQIQHKPEPQPQLQPSQPKLQGELTTSINQPPPSSELIAEVIENNLPKSNFSSKMKYEQNLEAPECLTEILQKQIGELVNEHLFETIESSLRQCQKNAYDSFTKGDNEYLQVLLQQVKKRENANMDVVSNLVSARIDRVESELNQGKILINHQRNLTHRDQLQKLEKFDLALMIKIKDGQLRSKMDILHHKMENLDNISAWSLENNDLNEKIHNKVVENMDANNYMLTSERTKIASEYVRYMHQQRRAYQKRKKERQSIYQKQAAQKEAELKEAEQMRDLSKRQQILQQIQMKRKKRQEEEKQEEAREEQARKLLAQHHRKLPIFKVKQKEFLQRVVKGQERYRQEKLKQIRQQRKAMSMNDIKLHQQKYLTKLQVQKAKRQQQFKLIMKSRRSRDSKRQYYKGSAHARMEQITKQDILRTQSMREASKLKANRIKEYAQVIHKNHQPAIDQNKKKQLFKLIQSDLMKKKRARKLFRQIVDQNTNQVHFQSYYEELPKKDVYEEGNKFFEQSKKHLKKKQKLTAIQKMNELQGSQNQSKAILLENSKALSEKKVGRNLWEIRSKQLQEIAKSQVFDSKNFESVKQNIQNLDSKAAMKQDLMKKVDMSMEEQLKERGMLDLYYLQSIKQKMRLLE